MKILKQMAKSQYKINLPLDSIIESSIFIAWLMTYRMKKELILRSDAVS
jgi:hypothetical protein